MLRMNEKYNFYEKVAGLFSSLWAGKLNVIDSHIYSYNIKKNIIR